MKNGNKRAKGAQINRNSHKKDIGYIETREKLGLTLAEMGVLFGVSRPYMSLVELKQRNLPHASNLLWVQMQIQCKYNS